ncbi:MAG: class I SAM-dependent methyltransferase [Elusimicrobiales bacterium]
MSDPRFSFGRNWLNFAANAVDDSVIEDSRRSLLRFLPAEDFQGRIFVDAGCGSGIFSLAALRLGAAKAVSFDYDAQSVEAATLVRSRFGADMAARWDIFRGDILAPGLNIKGDIVYSWGVLHHTGGMFRALEAALGMSNPGGRLAVALYNKTPAAPFWTAMKKFYNFHPAARPFMEAAWGTAACAAYAARRGTLNLRRERGMNVFYDAVDWIGGWPYECASFAEIQSFMEARGAVLEKEVTRLAIPSGKGLLAKISPSCTGCNEFLFRR